ncbi:MAG: Flp pilus assembly complex ATPase component TadA [Gemmatimonadetes bacterium]|nr:Flp pilus assembly complex ATPase component TadA [Gemmatimonadota bacterium]
MTAPDVGIAPDAWIGPYLVAAGLVPEERLPVLASIKDVRLWRSVVDTGLATDAAICAALASHFRLPVAVMTGAEPRAVAVLPEAAARKYHVVALALDEKTVRIATCDPRDFAAEQDLGFLTGRDVKLEVASPSAISDKLDEFYRPENSINRLLQGLTPTSVEVQISDSPEERDPALDAPMTKLVDAMISDAVQAGASDIHSEIEASHVIVRYRVDGILREVMRLPEAAGASLVRRVKIIAGLDVTNSMTPQDGRSSLKVGGQFVDMRVATAPVARRGEKLVIRILNKSNLRASIPALALPPEEESVLMRMLSHREGMVLVTGPTGSGKTTTLYAVLNHLKTGKVNIVTVEDPVEYDVDGISQMQVNEAQGFTFATALRSVLRQDPDIVLVGEIRDGETATIAIQAGLTGHFVFSTLHTNDAVSALVRLRDMGIDSFKLGTVLRGVVAQRLVRRICPQCAVDLPLDEVPEQARPPAGYAGVYAPKRGAGCKGCGGTGYKGRIAVMEMLPIEGAVGGLIESGASQQAILDASRPYGMRTLWEGGLIRYWSGQTSYEEIHRVLGESQERSVHASAAATAPAAPTATTAPAGWAGAGTADADGKGATILLADDDAQMRRLVRTVLEREGFVVVEAADGLDTLAAVETKGIDLILLDHDMPRLTGLGVLEELRASVATAALPVIMLTARTDDTESQALELGAQDYLTKPVQPRSLVARVRAVLKRTRME